jgi:hypothetical protein
MAEQQLARREPGIPGERFPDEVSRLLKLVRRLEHENAALRKELATRPVAA